MDFPEVTETPMVIVGYTAAPWESAMVVLRFVGPAQQAGLEVIQGNQGDQVSPELVSRADIIVIQRDFPRFREAYEQVIARARSESKPVIYETDDLLLEMPEDHSARRDYINFLLPILRAVIEADAVTTTTPTLQATLQPLNPNTWLLPNYLDDRLWSFRPPHSAHSQETPVVIGYMGGETHQADLESVAPVLLNTLKRYNGKVLLRFWGGKPPESLLGAPQVEWVPINEDNYAEFSRFFAEQECHLFIAPVRDNLFNRCKSALKYLEYSTHGLPGVYSLTPAYEGIVDHGVNGYLASNLEEWERYLGRLINDRALRNQMGLNAQQTVQEGWLLSQHCHKWIEAYQKAQVQVGTPKSPIHARTSSILKVTQQVDQYLQKLEKALQELEITLTERDQTIHQLEITLTGRNQTIHQLEITLTGRNQTIHQLNTKLIALDRVAVTTSNQLRDIQESRGWRLLQKVGQIRQKLIPLGSRREKILHLFWKK